MTIDDVNWMKKKKNKTQNIQSMEMEIGMSIDVTIKTET
jgi:hypothetical protein